MWRWIIAYLKSVESPRCILMPKKLRRMEDAIDIGVDPDEVPGVEELWLWRANKRTDLFALREKRFFSKMESALARLGYPQGQEKKHDEPS